MDINEVNRIYNEAAAEHHENFVKQAEMLGAMAPPPMAAPSAAVGSLNFCEDWPQIESFIVKALNIVKWIPFVGADVKVWIPKAKAALAVFDKVAMPLVCGAAAPAKPTEVKKNFRG